MMYKPTKFEMIAVDEHNQPIVNKPVIQSTCKGVKPEAQMERDMTFSLTKSIHV